MIKVKCSGWYELVTKRAEPEPGGERPVRTYRSHMFYSDAHSASRAARLFSCASPLSRCSLNGLGKVQKKHDLISAPSTGGRNHVAYPPRPSSRPSMKTT